MKAPWEAELAACQNLTDLAELWTAYDTPARVAEAVTLFTRQGLDLDATRVRGHMSNDWEVRASEIRADAQDGPSARQVRSAREKLAALDDESFEATSEYGAAVQEWADKHATHKKVRAQFFTKLKSDWATAGEKLTDGYANTLADADEGVSQLYWESEMAEAKMKAAKARLDHINRSFEHHRSLFVREDRTDGGRR